MPLSQIRLVVTNFDACFRFYRDTIGLHVLWGDEGGQYAGFRIGEGTSLTLFRGQPAEGGETIPSQARIVLIFSIEDLDGSFERLGRHGVQFVDRPTDYPEWGVRAAHLRDPAGNLLEISSPLPVSRWSETLRRAAQRYEQR
jgi:lactoylglutathione lyase